MSAIAFPNMTPVNSFGWVDDNSESGNIRVNCRNNLVALPLRLSWVSKNGFQFADGAIGGGNPDGSATCHYANSIVAMPAGTQAAEYDISFQARGTTIGVRFDATFNNSGANSFLDFDLIIDGVPYRVPRKRFTEDGNPATYCHDAAFVVTGLPDTNHVCRIATAPDATLASDHLIWGIIVDRNAGYEEQEHYGSSQTPAILTNAYQNMVTLWSSSERLGRCLTGGLFCNTSAGTVTVYLFDSATSRLFLQHDVAAGDTYIAVFPGGLAGFLGGTLQIKASANASINFTPIFRT